MFISVIHLILQTTILIHMKRINTNCIFGAVLFVLNAAPLNFVREQSSSATRLSSITNLATANQDFFIQVENLIEQGKQQGMSYLNSRNDKVRKSAKNSLDDAESMVKKKLKQEPNCEKCIELLIMANFYQSYFGFSKNYNDCIDEAKDGLTQFPENSRIAYYKGFAHYNAGQNSEAVKAFNRFLMGSTADTQTMAQVRQLLQDGQQRFLSNWNLHAQYYQSAESKILVYNAQTYKYEPAFQVTPEWEMGLGSQGYTALTAQATKLEDAELKEYLDNLISRLVNRSPGSPFNYQLTIVNSPEVNAVTPPGHIIVYTGLLAAAENESELAAVLSHELAHNYAHHQARAVLQKYHMNTAANAVVKLINPQTATAQIASQLGAIITVDLFSRAYSRFEEKEADLYGAHILFNAGYNPTASSNFFLKLYKTNPRKPIKFLSTHPSAPDRTTYITDYLESFPLDREMQIDSKDFQKMKTKLATLIPLNQQQGQGRGVLPK
jgi:Zn-dependent protease with chaperone function